MSGWIKLQRCIVDHWIAQDSEYLAVWIRMLAEANFETRTKLFNGQLITVERGQLIFGLDSYSATTKVSVMRLRRLIELLERDGMISRVKKSKYSIITTILNYDKHQGGNRVETPSEQAENIQIACTAQAQNNTIRNTELKNKNMSEKSDEQIPSASQPDPNKPFEQKLLSNLFEDFWKKYPVKHGKQEAKKAWSTFMRGKSESEIRKWSSLMLSYRAYRSEKNITEHGFNPLQNKMAQGFINSRCWEDEPMWIDQFKQEWLEYYQSQQTGVLNGTTN